MSNEKVEFEHNGKKYAMTEEEIEAAYRYKERQYRREDALRQLNYLVFDQFEVDEEDGEEDGIGSRKRWFESVYHITYEKACEMLDDFVDTFEDFADCNVDENQTWHDAIEEVLEEVGKNGRKVDC